MAKKKIEQGNWDRKAERLWLTYTFWKPADFAENHGVAVRTIRHYLSLGMPSHGRGHKGSETGGIRLSKSAVTWLQQYRMLTADGALRFPGMTDEFLSDLALAVNDEAMAYWKLYNPTGPRPDDSDLDEFLSKREAAAERRSWKTSFKEITQRTT